MEIVTGFLTNGWFWFGAFALITLKKGIRFVPQNRGYVVYTFGKYTKTLGSGLNFIMPYIQYIEADRNLKEQTISIPSQSAITKDNITLEIDGVLYIKVVDAASATNNVTCYKRAVSELAQTTMRSEIGKMELDKTFEERDLLNTNIVAAINEASSPWGVQVLRYEIKDIVPPRSVMEAMERQMKAEREKRAKILESEGDRQSVINVAEGAKREQVLESEGKRESQILEAEGEAKAIEMVAHAKATALKVIGENSSTEEGKSAVMFELARDTIAAHAQIAKTGTVILTDGKTGSNISETMAHAIAVSDNLRNI